MGNKLKKIYGVCAASLLIQAGLLSFGYQWILIFMVITYFVSLWTLHQIETLNEFRAELNKKFEALRKESLRKIGRW